jgi:hypothetical protein
LCILLSITKYNTFNTKSLNLFNKSFSGRLA